MIILVDTLTLLGNVLPPFLQVLSLQEAVHGEKLLGELLVIR